MARALATITNEIKTNIRTFPSMNAFKFPEEGGSSVSVFNTIISTVALSIYSFEVILDYYVSLLSNNVFLVVSGNAAWVRAQMLNFQYGDVVQLVNFVPTYVPVNAAHLLVTQCAVKDLGNGIIQIKVAKGTTAPFSPLAGPELQALKDYYNGTSSTQGVGFAGVKAVFVTLNPDRLYIAATIYFVGQYLSATVKANVIIAINNFLTSFSGVAFDGRVYMIRLVNAIQAVPGVSRVQLTSIIGRAQTVAFGSGGPVDIQGFYDSTAGHVISEDTVGQDLSTTLTMSQEV